MANQPGTSFNPKSNLTYARSITAAQVNAIKPVGFTQGGREMLVYNSGAVAVMVAAFNSTLAAGQGGQPTMVFPADGAPPTGQPGTIVPPGGYVVIGIRSDADSFCAIGQAAGPSLIFVQRGEGL